jgi:ketosteroid isomerase-like protein
MQQQNIEALRRAYAAFNRGDIAATTEALDPNIEWIEPPEFPGGGNLPRTRGRGGVFAPIPRGLCGSDQRA